ncbi:YidB family protein [Desulfosarcina sp.]|uniref:YidB family protein n=1 Tax=Desulfosarcina sp. TaxID=2027861 RepID=UPI0035699671
MDMANLLKMGATAFINSEKSGDAGSGLDMSSLISALSSLAGGGRGIGGFDLGSLLSKMDTGGLGGIAKSWLGDGSNQAISPDQITSMLGADKISGFASRLGLSEEEAAGGLSDALPQMVDKASSGGSLLDSIGGLSGAMGMAGKLFGK